MALGKTSFDYVVVGGGSAGCVLAARLSADADVRVCLLEAGPPDRSPLIHIPAGMVGMMRSKAMNWAYTTEPQPHMDGRRLFWPRGKTLGGSSASNAMIYIRGHASDYDGWAAQGNTGWDYASVLPLFRRAENNERGADAFHGVGGPLNVADLRWHNPLTDRFVESAMRAGFAANPDFNGATQEGVGFYQVTQKDGRRCSAAAGYLTPEVRARPNLTIITGAHATRVLIEGGRATCVEFAERGSKQTVRAERELLLCLGAVNTPHLLLLSGIGPGEEIRRQGLCVVHELPGVGRNLQDHLDVRPMYRENTRLSFSYGLTGLPGHFTATWQYLRGRQGMWSSNFAEAGGFIRSDPSLDRPDLQLHFLPAIIEDHGRKLNFQHGFSIHVCQLRPHSRGHIGLKTADPFAAPLIQPNYLAEPEDRAALRRGLEIAREIAATGPLAEVVVDEYVPGYDHKTPTDLDRAVREHGETVYHPVGTTAMGTGPMAVVDPELRVHGIDGLRVVDAGIMPTLIGGNTNAPTIMIAEKAADLVRGRRNARTQELTAA